MQKDRIGNQTIGCRVHSCRFNDGGNYCELARVQIEPSPDRPRSGKPEDESLCGSYSAK